MQSKKIRLPNVLLNISGIFRHLIDWIEEAINNIIPKIDIILNESEI